MISDDIFDSIAVFIFVVMVIVGLVALTVWIDRAMNYTLIVIGFYGSLVGVMASADRVLWGEPGRFYVFFLSSMVFGVPWFGQMVP